MIQYPGKFYIILKKKNNRYVRVKKMESHQYNEVVSVKKNKLLKGF